MTQNPATNPPKTAGNPPKLRTSKMTITVTAKFGECRCEMKLGVMTQDYVRKSKANTQIVFASSHYASSMMPGYQGYTWAFHLAFWSNTVMFSNPGQITSLTPTEHQILTSVAKIQGVLTACLAYSDAF